MTFRKATRTVSAATLPALEHLVSYWESRRWRRLGPATTEAIGSRRSGIWSQEMERSALEEEASDEVRAGRRTVVWFD